MTDALQVAEVAMGALTGRTATTSVMQVTAAVAVAVAGAP